MADELSEIGVDVIVTHPMHPDDNPGLYRLIGHAFGAEDKAAAFADAYNDARAAFDDAEAFPPRNALYLIWKDPWMAISADTYIANMLGLVNWNIVTPGADPALQGDAARYPEVTIDEESLKDIDLVLFSTEPYSFKDDHIADFQQAFPDHARKAHLIDGEMTSWYGSRAVRGLAYLRDFANGTRS